MAYQVPTSKCNRCGHTWILRSSTLPRVCPNCKSPYWNSDSEYKQEISIENKNADTIEKKLIEEMKNIKNTPKNWDSIIQIGWNRMLGTSDYPLKNIEIIENNGYSIYSWFMTIHKITPYYINDISPSNLENIHNNEINNDVIKQIKIISGWDLIKTKISEDMVKILAFLWYSDYLTSQLVHYPEIEAIIQELSWTLIENQFQISRDLIVESIEQIIEETDDITEIAVSWSEVIRFP